MLCEFDHLQDILVDKLAKDARESMWHPSAEAIEYHVNSGIQAIAEMLFKLYENPELLEAGDDV